MKLKHQIGIVIAVPLACELVFVIGLGLFLLQLEKQEKHQVTQAMILRSVNVEFRKLLEAASAFGVFELNHQQKYRIRFQDAVIRVRAERRNLAMLTEGERSEDLDSFIKMIDDASRTLGQAESLVTTGDQVDLLRGAVKMSRTLNEVSAMSAKVEAQERVQEEARKKQEERRDFFKLLVEIGLFLNIVIAAILVSLFNRSISSRLAILNQNMLALASGRPLAKPLTGTDEIASIDNTFHAAAAALTDAQRTQQAMTEYATEIICSLDDQGRFIKVNPIVSSVLGYDADYLLHRSIFSLLDKENIENARAEVKEAMESGSSARKEIALRRKNGTICDLLWSMRWSADEKSLFCILHDISARKQAERLKQEVLGMVSHDLRAPLTSLSVMFDLFEIGKLGDLNERGQQKVVQSRNIITRLMSLINDLLDMEKLESGVLELDYADVLAPDLIFKAADLVRNSADARQIKLSIPDQQITVRCDVDRMARVITNLLDNAIKFSPDRGNITISVEPVAGAFKFNIADEGKGVPADKAEMIFERFKQSDSSGAIEKKGTGLGLSICKAIVEAHGGTIGVSPNGERGSIFWFLLPRSEKDAQTPPLEVTSETRLA